MLIRSMRSLGLYLCRVVSRPLGCEPAPPHAIRYCLMDERDLLPHCADAALELPERHVHAAFLRGDLCVGALEGERLVGYEWLAFRPTPHIDGVWVEFDPGSRYGYKKFVLPEFRGRHIAAGLSAYGDPWSLRRGCTRTIAFIDLDNDASWRASARLGSRTIGYAGYLKLFDTFIAFRSKGAKALGFRFNVPGGARNHNWQLGSNRGGRLVALLLYIAIAIKGRS
jgi:GNAT superfamily N-acetyltransferase